VVSAEVVEVGDSLGSGVEGQGRGLSVDAGEDLLGVAEFACLEEQFKGRVRSEVDSDALVVFGGAGAAWGAGAAGEAFDEGIAEDVGGVFEEGDFAAAAGGRVVGLGGGEVGLFEDGRVAVEIAGDEGEGSGKGEDDGDHDDAVLGVAQGGDTLTR
jgi:hypothetical protein